jgi:hypothetical protein
MPAGVIFVEPNFALLDKSAEKPIHHSPPRETRKRNPSRKPGTKRSQIELNFPVTLRVFAAFRCGSYSEAAYDWPCA